MTRVASIGGIALILAIVGCSSDTATSPSSTSTSTSTSSSTPSASTERFDGILFPMATAFYSFNVGGSGGTVSINLASLSPLDRPGVLPETVQLGYGVPAGEACDVRQAVPTAPALVSQLTDRLTIGSYCASIADAGELTEPPNYSISVTNP
jgi:hypothetical protein